VGEQWGYVVTAASPEKVAQVASFANGECLMKMVARQGLWAGSGAR